MRKGEFIFQNEYEETKFSRVCNTFTPKMREPIIYKLVYEEF